MKTRLLFKYSGEAGQVMSFFSWNWWWTDSRSLIDWPILNLVMGENSIFDNKIQWRNRVFFSQGASHMGFTRLKLLISSTPAGSCIWREAAVLLCTSCLSDILDRWWHQSRRFGATVPARSPAFFLLLHFLRSAFYGMQQCCLYDFCLPTDRSDVSAHSVRVIRGGETFW